ncbi:RNA-guided pseudouridylation complex pseudouridine synthase subunit Cbf5 [Caldiplasma sukawensis]
MQKRSLEAYVEMENGCFICIDKPKGPTSHQIDYWVREITGIEKLGHVGTLDPQVSGVLVMALGKAVKLIDIAHEMPKEYICAMKIHKDSQEDAIREVFSNFVGDIIQLPPVKSAVLRKPRVRKIHSLEILEISGRDILFHVKCESGTYIRTLCVDIGYELGTRGSMTDLRRISTGPFNESKCITLQQLSDAMVLASNGNTRCIREFTMPVESLFTSMNKVVVKQSSVGNISHGSDIFPGGIKGFIGMPLRGETVGIVSEEGKIIATGKMLFNYDQIMDTKCIDIENVLIEPVEAKKKKSGEVNRGKFTKSKHPEKKFSEVKRKDFNRRRDNFARKK